MTNDDTLRSGNNVYEWFYVLKVCCKINLINLKSRAFTRSLQSIDIRYLLDHAASRNETNPTSRVLQFRFLKHLRRRGKLWSVVFSIFAPVSLSAFILFKQQHSRGIKMKLDIHNVYLGTRLDRGDMNGFHLFLFTDIKKDTTGNHYDKITSTLLCLHNNKIYCLFLVNKIECNRNLILQ